MMNYYLDPDNVTDYHRDDPSLELYWLFCVVAAGKTAKTQARLLKGFLERLEGDSPFEKIALADRNGTLAERVRESRLGQFNRLTRCFRESIGLNLRECSVSDLERIHGVGPKTSRFFIMHTRPNQRVAALDTHILKHLAANGFATPRATPASGSQYGRLEQAFLALADASGQTVADYDLQVWKSYRRETIV